MLYEIHEKKRSLMKPLVELAKESAKMYKNAFEFPGLSFIYPKIAAGYDLFYRMNKEYEKPVFGLTSVNINDAEVSLKETIKITKPFCQLRSFERITEGHDELGYLNDQPIVLIVAPMSGHYATLLRDTVRVMSQDHRVFITDWTNARLVPVSEGDFHLDDYVNYVEEFIRYLQENYGNCHVVSVCQPAVPVLAAVSLMATRGETTPLSMIMMGGPIDARKSPTSVDDLALKKSLNWFEENLIFRVPDNYPGAGRRVYPGFLQHMGFIAMNPLKHNKSHMDYFNNLAKGHDPEAVASTEAYRKFYDEYNAVLDMDAYFYLETIQTVFQDFNLAKGTWDVKGVDGKLQHVQPEDIRSTAILSIEGELDDITGLGQTEAANTLCSGVPAAQKEYFEVVGAGHYGIFSGHRWRNDVYPKVKAFIASHA